MLPFLKKEPAAEPDDDPELDDLDGTNLDDGITEDEITHDEYYGLTPDERKDVTLRNVKTFFTVLISNL